ncbi:MAG: phytanoyl-CoA dioxygenase family protein [Verrucomicrobiae bacterium]|nr:phytanoyl-CoA dioxygenase family protein [Verrucomicrobiae bacterium]
MNTPQTGSTTPHSPALQSALDEISREKAGILPPFLSETELKELVEAWWALYNDPEISIDRSNPRFIIDPKIYEVPAFARLTTHPVIQEAVRRTIGEFQLLSYAVVATPKNAEKPTPFDQCPFHIDHVVYSDVPVETTRDTFVCVWMNFEEQKMENGPFTLAVGTHKWRMDMDFFRKRPGLKIQDLGGVEKLTRPNTGPAGQTAVYSGLTWHAPTANCSDVIRKGLNMNFVPKHTLDTLKRMRIDLCGLSQERYDRLNRLIGIPGYIVDREPAFENQDIKSLVISPRN